MFYKEIFDRLNANDVKYLVVGGVALNLHGYPRMTYDLDLMISLDKNNIQKFWTTLEEEGFRPRVPIRQEDLVDEQKRSALRKSKNMFVASFYKGEKKFDVIDLFIENPIEFQACYLRRKDTALESISVPVMAVDDIIQLKSLSDRQQDRDDIEALKRLKDV